ncbi:hypothetical protein BHE74_00014207 [Ensete ventricosum]|nr:hypothetical protein GW17_00040583 [Ensete ventricosum]RWW77618.1 hypothetical protein BHE74_00014207 [Ensete ventricosum]
MSENPNTPIARSVSHSWDVIHMAPELDIISSDSTDSVKEQLRQVNQRLDEVQREFVKSKEELDESSKGGSPFILEILDKLVLTNFRLPSLKSYDGSSDSSKRVTGGPLRHLGCSNMPSFPDYSKRPDPDVVCWLRLSSISSYDSLTREFKLNFLASSRPRLTAASLLTQFVRRFATEI